MTYRAEHYRIQNFHHHTPAMPVHEPMAGGYLSLVMAHEGQGQIVGIKKICRQGSGKALSARTTGDRTTSVTQRPSWHPDPSDPRKWY